ncbi:hypothetical protein [Sorangium sp. So ce394]|uniref:hypothetical protein n=1 Tax=Sorangium sp. So ce394 TaxID=3133310 RepID=UPI003F5C8AFF
MPLRARSIANLSWTQLWSSLSAQDDSIYDGGDHELDTGGKPCTYRYLNVALENALDRDAFRERVIAPVRAWLDR